METIYELNFTQEEATKDRLEVAIATIILKLRKAKDGISSEEVLEKLEECEFGSNSKPGLRFLLSELKGDGLKFRIVKGQLPIFEPAEPADPKKIYARLVELIQEMDKVIASNNINTI